MNENENNDQVIQPELQPINDPIVRKKLKRRPLARRLKSSNSAQISRLVNRLKKEKDPKSIKGLNQRIKLHKSRDSYIKQILGENNLFENYYKLFNELPKL